MMESRVPLSQRYGDWIILAFFWLNISVITYVIDLEQLVIVDTSNFDYPMWPPRAVVDLAHWFGSNYDHLLMARPMWWRMTIWIDVLFFGPFYVFAIYAYTRGRAWIRIPSIIYGSVMITNVTIILGEELFGPHATPERLMVLMANGPWLLMPIFIIYRMWSDEHPFTREAEGPTP